MNKIGSFKLLSLMVVTLLFIISCDSTRDYEQKESIQISEENPFYWEYDGEPLLLLGGSKEDNLFNHPDGLEGHLDALQSAGGNYIRNTMSSRNPGNRWPFKKLENGLYDLEQWDEEYWDRFENLLNLAAERDIIVQVEIWDPWDYFKTEAPLGFGPNNAGWESNPFNPRLNVNYTAEESGLDIQIEYHSKAEPTDHVFFHTVPKLKDIAVIRQYQEKFVEKILSVSLDYPNVLYCMNNEIGEPAEWGKYWARFIRRKADERDEEVFLTDMRRNSDFTSREQVSLLMDNEHYDFFEISQNNANDGQKHYDLIMSVRNRIRENPKPLNNVKIYGGTIGSWTTSVEEGTRRFWRNIFGGCASARFHRPGPSKQYFGLGLSDLAQTHIKSMRMFMENFDIFSCEPANHFMNNRGLNEAYCIAEEDEQYAVYFPDGGDCKLTINYSTGEWEKRWLDISNSAWHEAEPLNGGNRLTLETPGDGQWAVLITPSE
ncbi:MAG: hypothetical protein KGY70_13480 [Bacteroidales bacterium]|nr:hypothetical protein [Bacteroidales bacterium]